MQQESQAQAAFCRRMITGNRRETGMADSGAAGGMNFAAAQMMPAAFRVIL